MSYKRSSAVTVARSCGVIFGKRIAYRLIKISGKKPLYTIEISFDGEALERAVACDIGRAAYLYELVVKNLVTPCTLDDVLEDELGREKENFVK